MASDDNGQDLRCCTDECRKCIADVIRFCEDLNADEVKGCSSALCQGQHLAKCLFAGGHFFEDLQSIKNFEIIL